MRINFAVCWIAITVGALSVGCGDSSNSKNAASGGAAAVGGSDATGGNTDAGGATSLGGGDATGGTSSVDNSAGGSNATGGGGGTGAYTCTNLPTPIGDANVAKPSGTAGNLKVIDWAGYTGAVSFTFDDQTTSQMAAYSTLNALGVKYTFYVVSGWGLTNASLAQAVTDGHEIGNHTASHSSTISASDIDGATTAIKSRLGVTPYTFAAPNGTNGSSGWEQYAKTRFIIDRGVSNGLMKPNDSTDQWNLPCYIPPASETAANMEKEILAAQTGGGWKVMLVHGFTVPADSSWQPVVLEDFTATVQYAKSLGNLWLDRVANIGSYWVGQKLVTQATASASGSDQVYTWSWPSFYPSNSCVRVTVDGGTLKQNGIELPWNHQGYYEVSLDAGSLTLSP
jgi:peptidoglycan/xylan/chitin deacetylase (PgdA/CDA1 family)